MTSQTHRLQAGRVPTISFRQAEYAVAGASSMAVVATVAGVVTGSQLMLGLAILGAVAAAGLAMVAARLLRRRVALSERWIRELRSEQAVPDHRGQLTADAVGRMRSLERTTYGLLARHEIAVLMDNAANSCMPRRRRGGHLLTTEQVAIAIDATLDECGPLEADRLVREYDAMGSLSLKALRMMARGLRYRGYMVRSLEYFRKAAAFENPTDIRQAHLQEIEIMVLSGRLQPTVSCQPIRPIRNRVLHVVGKQLSTTQNGYTIRTHNTAIAQVGAGWHPWVFVQNGTENNKSPSTTIIDGVTYCQGVGPLPGESGRAEWLQFNAEALVKVVRDVRPAVLHAHSDFYNAMLATEVGKVAGIPVVYETRGFWEESWVSRIAESCGWDHPDEIFEEYGVPEAYRWRRDREAEARRAADHVVTLGSTMVQRIIEDGLAADRITIVPNAVDTELFSPLPRNDRLAERWGIPDNAVVIGCVTSLVEYEGINSLIESFADLCAMVDQKLWLLVVGGGRVLSELREQAKRLNLSAVTFTGQVAWEEIPQYYSIIDIVVVPRRESTVCQLVTPLKPFEALAAGKVIAMSATRGLMEIDSKREVVEYYDPSVDGSLSALLRRLVVDGQRRIELQLKAREWIVSGHSWRLNAQKYTQVYEQVRTHIDELIH